jgi:undecaprenyl-diphosphatase
MNELNQTLFLLINAPTYHHPLVTGIAKLLGEYAIWLVPIALVFGWLRGTEQNRKMMLQAATSGLTALIFAQLIGFLWQHPRPFMVGIGHTLIPHVADSSFPSDHLTLLWAVSFSFLLNRRTRLVGAVLTAIGIPMAWARIYLGVHFPFDMLGAVVVASVSTYLCARYTPSLINLIYERLNAVYRLLFAPLIRRGWTLW